MRKYILLGLIPVLTLAALFASQYWFRRVASQPTAPAPIPTPPLLPTTAPIPTIKEDNREAIVGPQNSRIIVTINGLLSSISLEGVNTGGTSGQIIVNTTFRGKPVKFYGILPDVAFIDDRKGEYRTIGLFEFSNTKPEANLWVVCRPAFQTQTENFRCLALILRIGF